MNYLKVKYAINNNEIEYLITFTGINDPPAVSHDGARECINVIFTVSAFRYSLVSFKEISPRYIIIAHGNV